MIKIEKISDKCDFFFLSTEYFENPSQTTKSFVGDFYLTGDKVYKDEDDYLFFVGRHDDIILSAG